ncbi:hypothetical protein DYY67_0771 [Candidatus Nitrosotalea sp. TS]|uniref:hypothetical protein n=1 Tax=Candidatus Nitrosotalea sp. TS TaxID=2341020 RepID=UPI0014095A0F|nr:hypothetical protein [Candidatus Nitrosotalea sp. TS]NHI03701.1 hypothetical protein [Candidatus Nitrosotalea sp. TS]
MDTTLLIRYLGDTPQLRIIDFFLDNRSDYSKKEILESTGMSKTTLYKVWPDMEQLKVVIPARKFGNTTLFKLNRDNVIVKQVISLDSALGKMIMERMSESKKHSKAIRV